MHEVAGALTFDHNLVQDCIKNGERNEFLGVKAEMTALYLFIRRCARSCDSIPADWHKTLRRDFINNVFYTTHLEGDKQKLMHRDLTAPGLNGNPDLMYDDFSDCFVIDTIRTINPNTGDRQLPVVDLQFLAGPKYHPLGETISIELFKEPGRIYRFESHNLQDLPKPFSGDHGTRQFTHQLGAEPVGVLKGPSYSCLCGAANIQDPLTDVISDHNIPATPDSPLPQITVAQTSPIPPTHTIMPEKDLTKIGRLPIRPTLSEPQEPQTAMIQRQTTTMATVHTIPSNSEVAQGLMER